MKTITRSPFDFSHLVNQVSNPAPATPLKQPIKIEVIVHRDINRTVQQNERMEKNFAVIRSELKALSGREVDIEFNESRQVNNFNYKFDGDILSDLSSRATYIKEHRKDSTQDHSKEFNKILLITPYSIKGHLGIGAPGMDAGIASIKDDRGIAHAIGHMFGAIHEDAEVNYHFPWWYETIMNDSDVSLLHGNDYRFSDKNRENIRNHFKKYS